MPVLSWRLALATIQFSKVIWRLRTLPEELHAEATNMFKAQLEAAHGVVDV
jgi:hypothetical protein